MIYQNVTLSASTHISIWVPPDINNFKGVGVVGNRSAILSQCPAIQDIIANYGNTGLDKTF